jgi:AcrR family transcriptional regulator
MPTQLERRTRTRAALLAAARELFAERGYAATGREDIAERAGVTRGALYHHFDSQAAVAAAVLAELDDEIVDLVVAAAGTGPAVDRLRRSARAYLDACADPTVARLLVDAPTILGFDAYRQLSTDSCARLLGAVLDQAEAEGTPIAGDRAVATSLLVRMLDEAALLVASGHPRRRVVATVDAFLARLLAP